MRGSNRLSRDEVEARLASRGFTLTGEYVNTNTRAIIRCRCGHEWLANVSNVLKKNGTGCPSCAGMVRLTLGEIDKRLAGRGIERLCENTLAAKKSLVRCICGHEWSVRLGSLLNKSSRTGKYQGCPACRANRPLTLAEANARLAPRGIIVTGDFVSASRRTRFKCSTGHEWDAMPDNVLRGRGCPSCAKYGFDDNERACFYTMHIHSDRGDYVGFGITKSLSERMTTHMRSLSRAGFSANLFDLYCFDYGGDARALESLIKENIPCVDIGVGGFRTEAVRSSDYPAMYSLLIGLRV